MQAGFSVRVAFCVWKQAAHMQFRRCILWATLPPMVVNLKEPTILSWATNTAKWPKMLRMKVMADAQSGTNYKFFQLLKTSVTCLLRTKVGPFSSLAQCWNNSAHLPHAHMGWSISVEHRTSGECMPIGHVKVPPDCTAPVWQVTKCRSILPLTPGVKPSQ